MTKHITFSDSQEYLELDHVTRTPSVWEDALRIDTSPGSFEWWYFDGHFDDGTTAVIIFYTKPITDRLSGLKPGVQFNLTLPDGKNIVDFPIFSPAQFFASKESCDVHIGSNWVKGDLSKYELSVKTDRLGAHLFFSGVVPAWRPGNGKNYYTPDLSSYFGWVPAIPYGLVEGTLFYNGKEHTVKGNCYHDHNWGNIALENVFSHWYWGRAHIQDYSAIFIEITATKAYGNQTVPIFMLAKGDKILIEDRFPLTLQPQGFHKQPGGKQIPQKIDFNWSSKGENILISLQPSEILEATSLLSYFPKWKQILARLIVNPYYFRFKASCTLDISLVDIQDHQSGTALFEIMMLK